MNLLKLQEAIVSFMFIGMFDKQLGNIISFYGFYIRISRSALVNFQDRI